MIPESLINLWLAALPLMASPGPATLSIAAVAATYGLRKGFAYQLGVITGTGLVLLLVASGLTGLILTLPAATPIITIIGIGYILLLAFKIATAPIAANDTVGKPAPSYAGGLILGIANPKAYAAIGAVFSSQTLITNDPLTDALAKISALGLVIVMAHSGWFTFGSVLAYYLRHPRYGRWLNLSFAVLLVASVALSILPIHA